ncbi:hypothetical protein V6N13_065524 [Hibiscus sabdariffa]|uniref:DUF4283 domain-containing protein n=1 Tax=Hibiscus sabdariffa TaxID=183260 RepID=A0ABR2QQK9_9ROSI
MGVCRRPFSIAELANNIRKVGLDGFSVMRATGSLFILMFDNDKKNARKSYKQEFWCFIIRATKIEEAIGPKCDCCCELLEESRSSEEQHGETGVVEQRHGGEVKGAICEDESEGTVVPNSLLSKPLNLREVERMWEENKVEDWRVMETNSWMAGEDIGLIQRDEEQRCSVVNLSDECDLREEGQADSAAKSVSNSPRSDGP